MIASFRLYKMFVAFAGVFLLVACNVASAAPEAVDPLPASEFGNTLPVYTSNITLNAPLPRVLAVLADVSSAPRWVPFSDHVVLLTVPDGGTPKSATNTWFHMYFTGVFGQPPQDAVLSAHVTQSDDRKTLVLSMHEDLGRLPVEQGVLRIPTLDVRWTLIAEGAETTQVQLQLQVVPAIALPPMFMGLVGIVPQRALLNLQQQLADSRYQNTRFFLRQAGCAALFRGVRF